jgi:transposase
MGYTLVAVPSTEPKIRRQAMKDSITVVGMDVHKNSIQIVTADTDGDMEVRHYGKIGGTMDALDRAVRKLLSKGSTVRFVYEAGPCGYEIHRHLTAKGFSCKVVAPSKTPRKSGDRIMTEGMQRLSRVWSGQEN